MRGDYCPAVEILDIRAADPRLEKGEMSLFVTASYRVRSSRRRPVTAL